MKANSPPPPPNPQDTANAQAKANIATAQATQGMNMVNQATPYGSLNYTMNPNANPKKPAPGDYTASVTLSPEEQAKQNQQWEFDSLTNQLGIDQTKKLGTLLSEPVDLNNEATESRLMELGRKRLDPMLAQRRDALETKLYNQGVMPGTEAFARAMREDTEGANDAYNQLLLGGRGQSVQEALTQRNQPINEITALMSGGQVQQPNFIGTPSTNVQGTDIAGLTMDAYKYGPLAKYQAEQQQKNAMMSGLFQMGAAGLGGWARSDIRVKTDIRRIGETDNGFGIYAFRYRGNPAMQVSLMAQEVELVRPCAVWEFGGIKHVNYELALG